jgi:hypothetical protein
VNRFGALPAVKIQGSKGKGYAIINKRDFDPKIHTLFDEKAQESTTQGRLDAEVPGESKPKRTKPATGPKKPPKSVSKKAKKSKE